MRLGKFINKGIFIRDRKPVNWCIDCRSALAEAEVEYEDKVSSAIDVAFPVYAVMNSLAKALGIQAISEPAFAVIWTTTPWTLPANQAVSVHPDHNYNLVCTDKGLLILSRELYTGTQSIEPSSIDKNPVLPIKQNLSLDVGLLDKLRAREFGNTW